MMNARPFSNTICLVGQLFNPLFRKDFLEIWPGFQARGHIARHGSRFI
jgi:hypothetical protein